MVKLGDHCRVMVGLREQRIGCLALHLATVADDEVATLASVNIAFGFHRNPKGAVLGAGDFKLGDDCVPAEELTNALDGLGLRLRWLGALGFGGHLPRLDEPTIIALVSVHALPCAGDRATLFPSPNFVGQSSAADGAGFGFAALAAPNEKGAEVVLLFCVAGGVVSVHGVVCALGFSVT